MADDSVGRRSLLRIGAAATVSTGVAAVGALAVAPAAVADTSPGTKQGSVEFSDDFSQHPDGPPTTALTGQTYSLHAAVPAAAPVIAGGYLTYSDSAYLGGYATVQLEQSVIRFGGSFAFTPWSNGGGLACFAAMEEDIHTTQMAGQGVPRSPFHLTISPEAWGIDVFPVKGQPKVNLLGGLFATRLTADGATLHRAEVVIDQAGKTAYVTLPDGQRHAIKSPHFAIPATYVYAEPFRDAPGAGKTLAKFRNFWADSRNQAVIQDANALNNAPAKTVATFYMPAGQADMVLTPTITRVPGTQLTYTVPDSTVVLVRIEALLDVTAPGPVHFGLLNQYGALTAMRTMATKVMNGRVETIINLVAGSPGQRNTISMCAYLGGAAVATVPIGNYLDAAGANVFAGVSIIVTPT